MSLPGRHHRPAFTLVEAVIAVSITAMAGSALLLGIGNSMQTTGEVLDQAIATGMARQLMDEIVGRRYCGAGTSPNETVLGPTGGENHGTVRQYDDIDDYNGYVAQPPVDQFGIPLGSDDGRGAQRDPNFQAYPGCFNRWRQQVAVYYVNQSNVSQPLPAGQTSEYRAVEVTISIEDPIRGLRPAATLRRIVANVPPPQ